MQLPASPVALPRQLSSVVKWEVFTDFSRGSDIAASGNVFVMGQVVALNGAGKLVPLAPAASDGTEKAVRVLHVDVDASAGDVDQVVTAKRATIVAGSGLTWPVGITTNQKAAAIAQLDALGIVVR